jgi:hypothetical protein
MSATLQGQSQSREDCSDLRPDQRLWPCRVSAPQPPCSPIGMGLISHWTGVSVRTHAHTRTHAHGFTLAEQALYCLSHTSSPFCSGYFGDGVSRAICLSWPRTAILPISASQVARISGLSRCPHTLDPQFVHNRSPVLTAPLTPLKATHRTAKNW